MDKIFLRFVTFLNPVLTRMGVNTDQLHVILNIKLKMDNRRPSGLFAEEVIPSRCLILPGNG